MVIFLKWTIKGNNIYAIVEHGYTGQRFRAIWNKKTLQTYINMAVNDTVFTDVRRGFACLYNAYIDGKCKLGQKKGFNWGM